MHGEAWNRYCMPTMSGQALPPTRPEYRCCDVAVAQINYPSLKHNTRDSIEQARDQSHEEDLVQIFMLYVMQLGGLDVI